MVSRRFKYTNTDTEGVQFSDGTVAAHKPGQTNLYDSIDPIKNKIVWIDGTVTPNPNPTPNPEPALLIPKQSNLWKQTLPTGKDDSPTEIYAPQLATYTDKNTLRTSAGLLLIVDCDDAVTTPNTEYGRNEFREMKDSENKVKATWTNLTGSHWAKVIGQVNELPDDTRAVCIGQIHDKDDDVCEARVEDDLLFLEADGDPVGNLDHDFRLSRPYELEFIAKNSQIIVNYRRLDNSLTKSVTMKKAISNSYYKFGNYPQGHEGRSSVLIKDLQVSHVG